MNDVLCPARHRKARGQGASRRGEILEAAKHLFLQEGVEQATMRRIAAAVGVSPTALYCYFPDKNAILQAIAEGMFGELLDAHTASQRLEGTALERFRAGLYAYVNHGLVRGDAYRLTFAYGSTQETCSTIPAAEQSFAMLERGAAELIASGVFAARDPALVAEALWAAMHGLVILLLDHSHHIASDHQQLIDTLVEANIRGFMA